MSLAHSDSYRWRNSSTSGLHHSVLRGWSQPESTSHHLRRPPGHHFGDGHSSGHCQCLSKGWWLAGESVWNRASFLYGLKNFRTKISTFLAFIGLCFIFVKFTWKTGRDSVMMNWQVHSRQEFQVGLYCYRVGCFEVCSCVGHDSRGL